MNNNIKPRIVQKDTTLHILKTFGIRLSKKKGQNFLVDEKVVDAIIDSAKLKPGDKVLEIGPGIGTLTQALLEAGADVTAVEIDNRLIDILKKTLAGYENIEILNEDILKLDIFQKMQDEKYKIVANLPYYITTPIIMKLLEERLPIELLVTMVQKEVAQRMAAAPGGKDYGALSVAVQYYTVPEIMFLVPPKSFIPSPEVESAVIRCTIRSQPPVSLKDEKTFFKVVRAAFGQRRKTLNNALRATGIDKDGLEAILAEAAVDGSRRGEQLSLEEFALVANAWVDYVKTGNGKKNEKEDENPSFFEKKEAKKL